jgi:hypothetical protein
VFKYVIIVLLLIAFFTLSGATNSRSIQRSFTIFKKGKPIGYLNVEKSLQGNRTTYSVSSLVDVKFIKTFTAKGEEFYVFKHDTLIYSSIFRKINKKIKVDQVLTKDDRIYLIENKKKKVSTFSKVVTDNIVKLFFTEPKDLHFIFSDRYGKMIEIQKLSDHVYRLDMPNGSYSVFYYQNDVCVGIESVGTFYRIKLKSN